MDRYYLLDGKRIRANLAYISRWRTANYNSVFFFSHRKNEKSNLQDTCFDRSPAVGALSPGSDSGIGVFGSKSYTPDQPIHIPPHSTTTGATAVTKPPALRNFNQNYIFKIILVFMLFIRTPTGLANIGPVTIVRFVNVRTKLVAVFRPL